MFLPPWASCASGARLGSEAAGPTDRSPALTDLTSWGGNVVMCKEEGALRAVGTWGVGDGGHSGQRGLLGGLKKDGGSHVDVGWDKQAEGPASPWVLVAQQGRWVGVNI